MPRAEELRAWRGLQAYMMMAVADGETSARAWMLRENWWLNGANPVEALGRDQGEAVLANAIAFVEVAWFVGRRVRT